MVKKQLLFKNNRIYWLDCLRTFVVFLVILGHISLTYESSSSRSGWWIVSDPLDSDFINLLPLILDTFVMATLFYISGYLLPFSIKAKTTIQFIKVKFRRLIIPWIIAVLTLLPAYKIIFLYSRNIPQENWTTYFHWNTIWGQSWLWFLPVLFLFNMIYLIISKIDTTKINFIKFISLGGFLGLIYGYFIDYLGLNGWTTSLLLTFQNERLFIYFLVFLAGIQSYRLKIFESSKINIHREMIIHSLGWIFLFIYVVGSIYKIKGSIYNPLSQQNHFISNSIDKLIIRLSFLISLTYMIYFLVFTFKNYLNNKSRIWDVLNSNSYLVYVIHLNILGVLALVIVNINLHPIIKLLTLTISTILLSNLVCSLSKKLKQRFNGYKLIKRIELPVVFNVKYTYRKTKKARPI